MRHINSSEDIEIKHNVKKNKLTSLFFFLRNGKIINIVFLSKVW